MALLAAYSFDEASGDFLDYSGNGRNWTPNTGAIRGTGHTNGGLTKNATGLPVVAAPSFVGQTAWSMMFWQQGLGNAVWWCRLYNTSQDTGSGLLLLGGNLNLRLRRAGGNTVVTATPPGDGAWHHYAATYDGSVGRLYIDGTLVGTTPTAAAPLDAVDRIDIAEFTLGSTLMDDLRFHDTALDQATISSLMNTPVSSGPAPVENLTGALSITVGLSGALTTPPATIADLTGTLSLGLTTSGSLDAPAPSVPSLTGSLPLTVTTAGTLVMPTATVPELSGSLSITLATTGTLADPSAPTGTGTYTAEVDPASYRAEIDRRQYTAIVEA